MTLIDRIKSWKGWLYVMLALGVVASLFIAAARWLRPKRVVRETRKIKVPVPETDHLEDYHEEVAELRDRRADRERDPDRLSAKVRSFQERRARRRGGG